MLRKKVNPNGFCGGSLITDQWVSLSKENKNVAQNG
jgi:hypothetical protein